MMTPLLSITIPTYNRPNSLKSLTMSFLSKALDKFNTEIEVIVCDNSDLKQADENKKNLAEFNIQYKKNNKNLGFSGNVLRCLQEAKGEYIWIISDDDEVDIDAFDQFVAWIKKQNADSFDGIMLPFQSGGYGSNAKKLINTAKEWKSESGLELVKMIKNASNIPFILFSSIVLKNNVSKNTDTLHKIQKLYMNNDFIQIPLFSALIGAQGKIMFYDKSIQAYKSPEYVRFSMLRMVESLEDVLEFMVTFFKLTTKEYEAINQQCHYRRWMRWLIQDKLGVCKVKNADKVRWYLLRKWFFSHFKNVQNLKLAILAVLPVLVIKRLLKQ